MSRADARELGGAWITFQGTFPTTGYYSVQVSRTADFSKVQRDWALGPSIANEPDAEGFQYDALKPGNWYWRWIEQRTLEAGATRTLVVVAPRAPHVRIRKARRMAMTAAKESDTLYNVRTYQNNCRRKGPRRFSCRVVYLANDNSELYDGTIRLRWTLSDVNELEYAIATFRGRTVTADCIGDDDHRADHPCWKRHQWSWSDYVAL